MSDSPVRMQVYFSGHVQGVGFRYTTCRVASGRPVTGFVRNRSDGRVELIVEGAPDVLRRLIEDVQSAMSESIRHTDVQSLDATGEFDDFQIIA